MALQDEYVAFVSFGMSNRKSSTARTRVKANDGNAYIAAITQTLKDATPLGLYLLSVEDMSAGTLIKKGVTLSTEDDAGDYPAADAKVWAWDKLNISYQAGFENGTITIPGRDNTKFTMSENGVDVQIGATATTEVANFITRFNAVAVGKGFVDATLSRMWISK